jgi:hypothetical protein
VGAARVGAALAVGGGVDVIRRGVPPVGTRMAVGAGGGVGRTVTQASVARVRAISAGSGRILDMGV